MPSVVITNSGFNPYLSSGDDYHKEGEKYYKDGQDWYADEEADRTDRKFANIAAMAAMGAALAAYFALWTGAVNDRDAVIDKQQAVVNYLHDKDLAVDYPFMVKKQGVLTLEVPEADICGDVNKDVSAANFDGQGVTNFYNSQMAGVCGGKPTGWGRGDGKINAGRVMTYTSGIISTSGKRREERFIGLKTQIVLKGQSAARMNITPVLSNYRQAVMIHEGFAQIFAGGFNSAGVGLGTLIGQAAAG